MPTVNDLNKYCISSRVRLARNISSLPFPGEMSEEESEKLIDLIKGALGNEFTYINFSALPNEKKLSYAEKHIVSPELLSSKNKTALFINEDKSVAVMVGEEDHIRIQAFEKGNNLNAASEKAFAVEELIGKSVDYLFDENYGYITKCPTNIGTGMRASVMMFLPTTLTSHTLASYAEELTKMRMTLRGAFGESSSSVGNLYQISNSQTLGISEEEIILKVNEVVKALAEKEEKNQNSLLSSSKDEIRDKTQRALGILRSAYMISNDEAQKLISSVRLGFCLNILDVSKEALDTAISDSFPNTISILSGKETPHERDIFRAEYLRNLFRE